MKAGPYQRYIREALLPIAFVVIVVLALIGCTSKTNEGGATGGATTDATTGGVGAISGTGQTATAAGNGASGTIAITTGVGGSSGPVVTDCPVTTYPDCVGLTACPLTICGFIGKDTISATCSCLSGDSLVACCTKVKKELGDCMDYQQYPECKEALTGSTGKGPCTAEETDRLEAAKQPMTCYIPTPTSGCQLAYAYQTDVTACMRDCVSAAVPKLSAACVNCFGKAQQTVNDYCYAQCGSPICLTRNNCAAPMFFTEYTKCFTQ